MEKRDWLSKLAVGNIVAFSCDDDMYSGKVIEIVDDSVTIKTRNGSIYYIKKQQISWIKNGTRYPKGIYNALNYTKERNKNKNHENQCE